MATQNRLPEIIAALPEAVRAALMQAAEEVVQSAKDRVPVDTGDLQRAIHVELTENGVEVLAGDRDVFYGHIVEHGSVNTPARPFLVPALEENRDKILAHLQAAVRRVT